jgi:hypothetical protein
MGDGQRNCLDRAPGAWARVRIGVAVALGSLGLLLPVGLSPALAAAGDRNPRPHEFDIVYRGVGDYAYDSQLTADNGCTTVTHGNGEFAFDQEWDVFAKVNRDTAKVTKIDHVSGPEPTGGPESGQNRAHFDGNVFGAACPSEYLGTFDCTAAHLNPRSLDDLIFSKRGSRFIITAEGISELTGAITGSDSIGIDGESCAHYTPFLPTPNSAFGPTGDAWGKIPVKEATLAHLKRRHHFQVTISAGHYTDGGPSNYNKNGCLGINDHNPTDSCTPTIDTFRGTFSVHRVG